MFRTTIELIQRRPIMSIADAISSANVSQVKRHFFSTMPVSSECKQTRKQNYKSAISALNTLQSNYSVLQDSIQRKHQDDSKHISDTVMFLDRIGIPLSTLDQMPVIHISGTKGKGSTCAMVESILRSHGYRTGFFSSPHLVSVTERIRLDGVPIGKERFAEHFWSIYNRLVASQKHVADLPSYFGFLTVMAIDVFLREKVDVCVIEVGVGGRYDSTNVLPNTPTVGITSLGLEHTKLLGETIEEIAWQKAGIIKHGSDVFTTAQSASCLEIIQRECDLKNAKLHVTPSRLDEYHWSAKPERTEMKPVCAAAELNTSLAIQIAGNWIRRTRPHVLPTNPLTVTQCIADGIDRCFWPGRLQRIPCGGQRTLYLDGAHTVESMDVCARWFHSVSQRHHTKLLIFNTTGERDSGKQLSILSHAIPFDAAFFSPNVAACAQTRADTLNHNFPLEKQLQRCHENCALWRDELGNQKGFVHESVESVFDQIENNYPLESQPCDILITGSIHLLGATLSALNMEKHAYSAT